MPVLNTATAVYAGATAAQKVYQGSTLVWMSRPWNPSDLAQLDAWIDVSQLVGYADGQAVNSITELSRHHRVFTAAGSAPKWRAGNPPSLEFVGYDGLHYPNYNNGTAGVTLVGVAQRPDFNAAYPMLWSVNQGGGSNGYELRHEGANAQLVMNYTSGGPVGKSSYNETAGTHYLKMAEFKNGAGGGQTLWINGTQYLAQGTSVPAPNQPANLRLSGRDDGYWFVGQVKEALVFQGVLSSTDRLKVQDYLMAKHGLLPV